MVESCDVKVGGRCFVRHKVYVCCPTVIGVVDDAGLRKGAAVGLNLVGSLGKNVICAWCAHDE